MHFDSAELDARRGIESTLFATASSSFSSQWTHTHNPLISPTCHPEDTCPICQMYADHFDFPTLNSRREQLRDYENRTHQVDIELLKLDLCAARDRILALETAYDELQLAYEKTARSGIRSDGDTMLEEEERMNQNIAARSFRSSASVSNQCYVDVDDEEWEIPATPWTANSPSSSGSLPLARSIGTTPYSGSSENIPITTPVSTISTPSSLSSFFASAGSNHDSEHEPETPALTNGSQEDALRYAELLEQCNYNVKAANAVWKEWEAAERERQDVATTKNILNRQSDDDSEDDTDDENPDSDWEWEPYDYKAYECANSPTTLSPINLRSCSSDESINPVQTSSVTPFTSDIHRDLVRVQTRPHPVLPFPLSLAQVHPIPSPQSDPVDVEPTIYVDASCTGIGFCFCVPTSTNAGASNSSKNMTCYWLTWKWVRGHPAIPVGISGQVVMSWAELIALELGVHVTCTMRSTHTSSPPFFTSHQRRRRAPFACATTEELTIYSDNTGVVTALSPTYRTWTPKHGLDAIVKRILDTCEERGAQLAVRWVPSKANLADGPSKGRGVHVRDGAGAVVASAVGGCGERLELGSVDTLESEMGREMDWMEWVGASLYVPNHLQSFVQGPTGGVVELRHMLNG